MRLSELIKGIRDELLLVPGGLTTPTADLVEVSWSPPCASANLSLIQLSDWDEA